MQHFKPSGFTILELLVTVIVLGVLATIGIPSYQAMVQNNKIQSLSKELISDLSLAQSEAIKRGVAVTICAANGANFTQCNNANDWSNGWMIFANPDENTTFAGGTNEPLIKVHEGLSTNLTLTTSQNTATYRGSGFVAPSSANLNFIINATGCSGNSKYTINLTASGQVNVAKSSCP